MHTTQIQLFGDALKLQTSWLPGALLAAGFAHAAGPDSLDKTSPIDVAQAQEMFREAGALSAADGGRLWGKVLYGPILLVDPETRALVANEADTQGVLHKEHDVYVGTLPKGVGVADTPTEWSGKRWTMLRWPLQPDTLGRHVTLAHEMFHRIQPAVGVPMHDALCPHLDTVEGRIWLQLEWRALAAALAAHGAAQTAAVRDALAFRAQRHQRFPGSADLEAAQELAEGIPEYTGTVIGTPDANAARWRAIGRLSDPEGGSLFVFQYQSMSFVRAFAYVSGPAYGLLLDQRLPGWRKQVNADTDLSVLLGRTVPSQSAAEAVQRAGLYGESAIRLSENDRAAKKEAERAHYRALLVDGPTFRLQFVGHYNFQFSPGSLISLDTAGVVYPTFHVTADWGILDVKEGVLVPQSIDSATLAAPAELAGGHIRGQGWSLELTPGWHLVPSGASGSFTPQKD
jgi:hypothetical protein